MLPVEACTRIAQIHGHLSFHPGRRERQSGPFAPSIRRELARTKYFGSTWLHRASSVQFQPDSQQKVYLKLTGSSRMSFYKQAALVLDHLDKNAGSVKGSLAASGVSRELSPSESKRVLARESSSGYHAFGTRANVAVVIETLKCMSILVIRLPHQYCMPSRSSHRQADPPDPPNHSPHPGPRKAHFPQTHPAQHPFLRLVGPSPRTRPPLLRQEAHRSERQVGAKGSDEPASNALAGRAGAVTDTQWQGAGGGPGEAARCCRCGWGYC